MPVKKRVNEDFFKKWSPEMAYVLGFFAADGNMVKSVRGNHYIAFYGSDKNIVTQIKRVMQSKHKLSKRESSTGVVYRFQIGNKELYGDLTSLGFTSSKASRMLMPNIPDNFVGHFVRGYFDGDGNVWVGYVNKSRKTPTRVIQATFTSGSHGFLEGLCHLLQARGLAGGTLFKSKQKNFSRLTFSTLDALKLAEIMYNGRPKLFLKRKRIRFEQFDKLRW